MPDLHGWIAQQISEAERVARDTRQASLSWQNFDMDGELRDDFNAGTVAYIPHEEDRAHIARHDPAAVLRRCEADRRVLARHRMNPDAPSRWETVACEGCGTYGDCDWPVTDNINDCPELLDLAHAHGITEEILAGLDRPEPPPRPEPHWECFNLTEYIARLSAPRTPMADVPTALRGPQWKDAP